jgi:hypothetical protein
MQLLKALFESAELPTDFQEKTTVLFETALTEAVDAQVAAKAVVLQEAFDSRFEVAKKDFISEASALFDTVLESTIVEWTKENVVALDTNIKVTLAESFLNGFKGLLEKADVELTPSDATPKLNALQEQVDALTKTVAEKTTALTEATNTLTSLKTKEIITEMTQGLPDTVTARISKLSESFGFKSEDDFRSRTTMIIEAITGGKTIDVKGTFNADGTIVPVDSTKPTPIAQVSLEATDPNGDPVETVTAADKNQSALQETFNRRKDAFAPHLQSDLVQLTLGQFNK